MANPFREAAGRMRRMGPRADFAAAQSNRLLDDWVSSLLSPDALLRTGLSTLRARSRQVVRDNGYAAGWVTTFTDQVLGPDGIGVKPRMRKSRGKLWDDYNLMAWEAFTAWGAAEICTADGHNEWPDVQRLAFATWATDGEFLARRVATRDNAFGYELQLLDADQLDETYNVRRGPGQNEIRMGVEINAKGRPVAYHFYVQHPYDLNGVTRERTAVPASEVIHWFVQQRPGQTRGVPPLTPVLIAMHMLDTYSEAEIFQARLAASQGGFFETNPETYTDIEKAPTGVGDDRLQLEMETGLATQLPPGVTFKPWNPTHPNGNFEAFTRAILRWIARGAGMSYQTFTGDLSQANYSSDRGGRLAERAGFRVLQRRFASRVIRPVYRDVLVHGSLTGLVELPTPEVDRWCACDFDYPGWPWVDPAKDLAAVQIELGLKMTSLQRVAAERGRDLETVFEEIAEEKRLAAKYGLDLDDVYANASREQRRRGSATRARDEEADDTERPDDSADEDDPNAGFFERVASRLNGHRPKALAATNGHGDGNGHAAPRRPRHRGNPDW